MALRRKPKPGPCYACDPDKGYYWACEGCRLLWKEQDAPTVPEKERRPIKRAGGLRPSSRRRRQESVAYAQERSSFLGTHRRCEVGPTLTGIEGWECDGGACQVHHVVNRSQARSLVTDVRNFCAICPACHEGVTVHRAPPVVVDGREVPWAKANGWSLPALTLPVYTTTGEIELGSQIVLLDEVTPLVIATGRREWPELFVLAFAAGLVEHDTDPSRVVHRNGRSGDARLCNIKILEG